MAPQQPGDPTPHEASKPDEPRPHETGPRRPVGFWLRLVDQLIEERLNSLLAEHGVTRRQWQLLNVLLDEDATGPQLAEALAPFRASGDALFSEEVAELLESEWVVQDGDTLGLTERGRTSVTRIGVVVARARAEVATGISADEYAQTLRVLERMAKNLGWQDAAGAKTVASG